MEVGSDDYYRAAMVRLRDARLLHDGDGSYSLAIYSAGVAVECICRDFIKRQTSDFDSRHVIERLAADSRIILMWEEILRQGGAPEEKLDEESRRLRSAFNDVKRAWSNNYRFLDDAKVRSELVERRLHRGIKGNVLKELCRRTLSAAHAIVETGVVLWTSNKK